MGRMESLQFYGLWLEDKTFGRKEIFDHSVTPELSAFHLRHVGLIESAWSSLTRLAVVTTKRKAVFTEVSLRDTPVIGSKGDLLKACRTSGRSHAAARLSCIF